MNYNLASRNINWERRRLPRPFDGFIFEDDLKGSGMLAKSQETSGSRSSTKLSQNQVPSKSQADQVLIALYRCSNGSTVRVPYEEIVLQAWKDFPESFSLRNHPEYPDASDIHKKIYQTLKPAGLVVSLGNKVFRLTDAGIAQGAALLNATAPTSKPLARLSREDERLLQNALSSRALAKWEDGRPHEIIDYDARLYFQFSTGTAKLDRRLRLKAMRDMVEKARKLGLPKAETLHELTSFLSEKFDGLFAEGS